MDAIRRFAEHVSETSFADLPSRAVAATTTFVLDTLGVAMAGSGEPLATQLARTASAWGRGDEATVWGTGQRLPAPSAALVNAYQAHCLEFDCVHEGAVVHAMATTLPAVLAFAERAGGASGRDLVTAVALGVDVAAGLGVASRAAMRFFRPATAGAFGAVAAVGKLAGLDVHTLVSAFGVLYGQLAGTLQPHLEASPVLALQMGFNARAALMAVDLARDGLEGPRDVLEGRYGYFALFEGEHDVNAVLATLGTTWRVSELAHKPFPCGRLTHGAIDGLQRLRAAHAFTPDDVAAVRLLVPPLVARLVDRPDVADPVSGYARLCLPFVAATALLKGTVDVPHFRGEWLRASHVHDLARRIEIVAAPTGDENAMEPQTVEVTLRDGTHHAVVVEHALGHPAHPLTRAQHLDKLRRNTTYGAAPITAEARERLIGLADRLETLHDVRELIAAAAPWPDAP
jgi:2-methylcitrate dehydratase PrpD